MLDTLRFIWAHPISSADRSAALSRYLRWQIGTRLLGAPVVIPFVEHTRLVCERGMTGATGNLYCGLHEFRDMAFLLHFLRPGDVFVDVGANVGSFSVLASGVVGARAIALEPVLSSFTALTRNIAVNRLEPAIEPLCVAAGPESGRMRLSSDRGPENGVVDEGYAGTSAEVAMVPLDDVIRDRNPVLLKVDAEGSEGGVLRGASVSLRRPTLEAVLLEGNSAAIAQAMAEAGFAQALYEPMTRKLDLADGARRSSAGHTLNNLWVRNAAFVQERCATARQFTVYGKTF